MLQFLRLVRSLVWLAGVTPIDGFFKALPSFPGRHGPVPFWVDSWAASARTARQRAGPRGISTCGGGVLTKTLALRLRLAKKLQALGKMLRLGSEDRQLAAVYA